MVGAKTAGPAVVILDFQIFYLDGGGLGAPSSPHCEIAYVRCLQTCGEMACYTSCETLRQYCDDSH